MNKVYFGNNNMGSTAVKAFLLGWPHTGLSMVFSGTIRSFTFNSVLTAAEI